MLCEDVVLRDEVTGARVQAARQERRKNEVRHSTAAGEADEGVIESELHGDVDKVNL